MNRLRFLALFFAAISILLISSCQVEPEKQKAKYVFLFIGDGMGIAQVTATEAYQASLEGKDYTPLNFSKFPVVSFSTTYAENQLITCSAAAGTALATGQKTSIGTISMDETGEIALETIAEKAKQEGFKVGIISSVSLDHATPATFYAHQKNRSMYHEISLELAESNFDFFGGGGLRGGTNENVNVFEIVKKNGFNFINARDDLMNLQPADSKVLFVNPQLTNGEAMMYAIDQPEYYITLAEITQKAIEYLYNDKGFFMMVEGGKIDWLCHANDGGAMVREVLDFSEAVEKAVEFYNRHPDETLIIVTADHETGGLSLGNSDTQYESNYALLENQVMSGEEFNKVIDTWKKNNHLNEKGFKMMMNLIGEHYGIGLKEAPVVIDETEKKAYNNAFKSLGISQENEYGEYSPLTYLSSEILSKHAGIGWTSKTHTAVTVPVYVLGVNCDAFRGKIDNTDIPNLIWETMH